MCLDDPVNNHCLICNDLFYPARGGQCADLFGGGSIKEAVYNGSFKSPFRSTFINEVENCTNAFQNGFSLICTGCDGGYVLSGDGLCIPQEDVAAAEGNTNIKNCINDDGAGNCSNCAENFFIVENYVNISVLSEFRTQLVVDVGVTSNDYYFCISQT
jgi:hypothetical protein